MSSPLLGKAVTFSFFPCSWNFFFLRIDLIFLPGQLSPEAQASRWLPAVNCGVPWGISDPIFCSGLSLAHRTLVIGTPGPGDEQAKFLVWSCSRPVFLTCLSCPPGSSDAHWKKVTLAPYLLTFPTPGAASGREQERPQRSPVSGPARGISLLSSFHLGGGCGWEGPWAAMFLS